MAGIGIELKKLFHKKGLIATIRAYGYAGIVCTGPMILGVLLMVGITTIAEHSDASKASRDLLVSMVTYDLLASLLITSVFSMLTSRCTADMLYMKNNTSVIPTFYGSLSIMLLLGTVLFGTFLHFAGISILYRVLNMILFLTLIVVWTEINYLTAIKDYQNIIIAFVVALATAAGVGLLLIYIFKMEVVTSLLIGICMGYGLMMIWYFILLYRYFPEGFGTSFEFLKWFDNFPELALVGFFVTLGLFGHLVIMWASPLSVHVQGLYYGAPEHDVPALVAFTSILITTINFVTSVETRFYPQYKDYFSLFNDGGAINDIEISEKNMLKVLREELGYLAQKQVFTTLLFIVLGSIVLPRIMYFTEPMLGLFRVLCIGYAFYAIGNSIMLVSLYFADNRGALISTAFFAALSNILTIVFMFFDSSFYGFGFVIGGAVFCLIAWFRLSSYLDKLKYHVLGRQPIFARIRYGVFSKMCDRIEKYSEKRQKHRHEAYDEYLESLKEASDT